jgi:tRNA(Ile)-lysidine synthase
MSNLVAIQRKVGTFVARDVPSLADGRALLSVSGGADSVATAAILCESGVIDASNSVVAHFDHRLRGNAAADRDRAAVVALCGRYGLDFADGAWDEPRPAEAAAREARYAFLRAVATRADHLTIVTGHTADDQAETVLMHAMRGAGLHGLSGMAPETTIGAATIARPALCLTREETRAYCRAARLPFVDDETNDDRRFLRNRVRLDLLPQDPTARSNVRASLVRIADDARRTAALLDAEAVAAFTAASPFVSSLSKHMLRLLGPAVAAHAFRRALVRLLGDARDVERRHYDLLARAMEARTGAVFELPRGIVVTVDAHDLLFTIGPPQAPAIPLAFEAPLPFTGIIGAWRLDVAPEDPASPATIRAPDDAVIRGRRAGDRMRLAAGSRKLQDILVDLKIPRRDRDGLPVIACGSNILWTPFRAADPAAVDGRAWSIAATPA